MMNKIKRFSAFLLAILFAFPSLSGMVGAVFDSGTVTDELHSNIYYMENLDEGTVFFEKNSQAKTPAAAYIKIIAAIVAIEKWGNLEGNVKITEKNLSLIKYEYGIRTAKYKAGEVVSKRELLDCMIIYSANDAASVIASEISGSLDAFIKEMQLVVNKIGCSSTVVKNIHGFDQDGQYTTAQDVAKIIKYALNFPVFVEAFSAKTVTLKATELNEERVYNASNKMMNATIADYYHDSVTGGKQTSTDEAGECIAVVSNKDGYSYLTIVMGGRLEDIDKDTVDENTCMTDAKKMLKWVYNNIRYRVVVSTDLVVSVVDVVAGRGTDKINLVPEKEASALVPAKATPASVSYEIVEGSVPEKIYAPIKAGEVLGQAKFLYAGQELITLNLVAQKDVSLSLPGLIMAGIISVITSIPFIVIISLASLFVVAYIVKVALEYINRNDPEFKKNLTKKFNVFGKKKKKTRKRTASTQQSRTASKTARPTQKKTSTTPSSANRASQQRTRKNTQNSTQKKNKM